MAKIIVKSGKFGIVVKELDTASYQDEMALVQDLLQAIPDADWFEERPGNNGAATIHTRTDYNVQLANSDVDSGKHKAGQFMEKAKR